MVGGFLQQGTLFAEQAEMEEAVRRIAWNDEDAALRQSLLASAAEPLADEVFVPDLAPLSGWQRGMARLLKDAPYADVVVKHQGEELRKAHRLLLRRCSVSGCELDFCSDMTEVDMTQLCPRRIDCERMLFETYTSSTCGDCAPLAQHLKKQLDEGIDSDVQVTVGSRTFRAHKCMLAVHSEFFQTALTSAFLEMNEGVVDVHDARPEWMEQIMHYIYTGEYEAMLESEELVEYLCLAHRLVMPSLVSVLVEVVSDSVTVENVCSLLNLSDTLNMPELRQKCLFITMRHLHDLQDTEYHEYLTSEVKAELKVLRASVDARIVPLNFEGHAREIVAILKEVVRDRQERLAESVRLFQQDALLCERRMQMTRSASEAQALTEWRDRLAKVRAALDKEATNIEQLQEHCRLYDDVLLKAAR